MATEIFTDEVSITRIKGKSKPTEYYLSGNRKIGRPLGVRVSPKGKKTFFIVYYAEGKTKKFTLGVFPALSLTNAKKLANEYADRDPVAERVKAIEETEAKRKSEELELMTLRTMTDLWEEYSSLPKYKQKTENTRKEEYRKWVKNIKPVLGDVPVKDIEPVMISSLLKNLAKKSPISANRLYSFMKILFRPALADGWISIHPMQYIDKPSGEKPRKRFLTDDEIKTIWPHLDKLKENPRDILRIILLTAQRPGEVSSMQWNHIDLENNVWRQSKNKTDTVNLVPLSPQVVSILSARDRKGKWIFPSTHDNGRGKQVGYLLCTRHARRYVQQWSGITNWTAHDLRRTARTIMSRLQIKQHVRERVLNHSQGGIVGIYDQYDYLKEKADALDKLGREIDKIIGIDREPAKILQLRQINQ